MFGDGRGVCRLLDSLTPRRARARTGDAEDSREEDRTCPSLPSQHHWLVRPELDKNNKQQDHHHRESTSKWANEVWGESCSHTVSHILIVVAWGRTRGDERCLPPVHMYVPVVTCMCSHTSALWLIRPLPSRASGLLFTAPNRAKSFGCAPSLRTHGQRSASCLRPGVPMRCKDVKLPGPRVNSRQKKLYRWRREKTLL